MLKKMTLEEALKAKQLHPDCVDTGALAAKFVEEMEAGLRGDPSCLMMIPSYLTARGKIRPGEPVAMLDAGGTNLRVASVQFDEQGNAQVLKLARLKMPGTTGRITAKEMFARFAEAVEPMIGENGTIAFCFSYAVTALPSGEGRIIGNLSKEVQVDGADGMYIGEELIEALRARGVTQPLSVLVLNDTLAVLYSALTAGATEAVGFILGTGTNTAYMEKASGIGNALPFEGDRMGINMESGDFAFDPMGPVDAALNRDSRNVDEHLHEKHVSGVYLGELMARACRDLASEGYFSGAFGEAVARTERFDMRDVGTFLDSGTGLLADLCATEEDARSLREVILGIEERAGKLIAANLAGVLIRMRRGGTEGAIPVAENGTTFQKALPLRETCMAELAKFKEQTGEYRFVSMEDDTLVGTAAAAFLR